MPARVLQVNTYVHMLSEIKITESLYTVKHTIYFIHSFLIAKKTVRSKLNSVDHIEIVINSVERAGHSHFLVMLSVTKSYGLLL